MKYIRQEHIVTTICKENLEEVDIIKGLMENLLKESLAFSISIKKAEKDIFAKTHITSYDNTRLKKVNEDSIDLIVFGKSVHVSLNNIKFEDIVELKVITTKSKLVDVKDNLTRFDLIDIEHE